MASRTLTLTVLDDLFAVCRLPASAEVPGWASGGTFVSITRTPDELSVICPAHVVPADVTTSKDWRCLKVEGPFAFEEIGVLHALAGPLAEANISMLAVATYDTDYLLVRASDVSAAIRALTQAGHAVRWQRHADPAAPVEDGQG